MILVTGGTGLVGSHLLYDLAKCGYRVRALKREESNLGLVHKVFSYYTSSPESLLNLIEWVDADIMDAASLEEAMQGCMKVYHCAAVVSFVPNHRKEMLLVNVEGTANVVNACLQMNIQKLCHVSSIASLGRNSTAAVVTEETHWKTSPQNSWYAISKYGAEREVWRGAEEGLNVVVVNPSVIIGPGDWSKGSIALFKTASKGLKYYTRGQTGYVDVRDVSRAMIALMESDLNGERYLLNAANLPFRTFFDMLHRQFRKPDARISVGPALAEFAWRVEKLRAALGQRQPVITRETARAANYSYTFSSEKIRNALGFQFTPIENSVREICELYLKDASPHVPGAHH